MIFIKLFVLAALCWQRPCAPEVAPLAPPLPPGFASPAAEDHDGPLRRLRSRIADRRADRQHRSAEAEHRGPLRRLLDKLRSRRDHKPQREGLLERRRRRTPPPEDPVYTRLLSTEDPENSALAQTSPENSPQLAP